MSIIGNPLRTLGATGIIDEFPTFTGSYVIHGDLRKGYIELLGNGNITLSESDRYDIFIVGYGGNGYDAYSETENTNGGGGGGGGYFQLNHELGKPIKASNKEVTITLSSINLTRYDGRYWRAETYTAPEGGNGTKTAGGTAGSELSGVGGYISNGGNGGIYAFGDPTFDGIVYGSGGGSGSSGTTRYYGGSGGGGDGGYMKRQNLSYTGVRATDGQRNTGSGGGGGSAYKTSLTSTMVVASRGYGSSGKIIIRWGY